jgi:hypothetical protein
MIATIHGQECEYCDKTQYKADGSFQNLVPHLVCDTDLFVSRSSLQFFDCNNITLK